jgi:hypothetical protein
VQQKQRGEPLLPIERFKRPVGLLPVDEVETDRVAICQGMVQRVIYATNLIESMNARLRKVTRNRGQFRSEQAALKVLYLAVRNLEDSRSPNVGTCSSGWKQALQAFTICFDGRIPPHEPAAITYTDGRTLQEDSIWPEGFIVRWAVSIAPGLTYLRGRGWVVSVPLPAHL